MTTPIASLGYVIFYVRDVGTTLEFYERAFGLARRFFHDDQGMAYGELETGATRLAFASLKLGEANFGQALTAASRDATPLAAEIAFVADDVSGLYERAVQHGALAFAAPTRKPWGQTVAYVRDVDGHLIEICTPLP